jgi:hypothetical protein
VGFIGIDPLWVDLLAKQAEIRYHIFDKQKPVLLKKVLRLLFACAWEIPLSAKIVGISFFVVSE